MSDASPVRWHDHAPTMGEDAEESSRTSEQRSGKRYTLLIRTAKLIGASGEFLCVVRDVSREGLKIRTFHRLPPDQAFAIDFGSGESHRIHKVWEKNDLAGFRFADPVALERLLSETPDSMPKRGIRLRLELPLVLHSAGRALAATFVDISQHGACIRCEDRLALNERVRLVCDTLPELTARVRWRRNPLHGLIFEQTFRFDELARLTAPLQVAARAPEARLRAAG